MGDLECVLGPGGGAMQDARGFLVALGSQQVPDLCSSLSVHYLLRLLGSHFA